MPDGNDYGKNWKDTHFGVPAPTAAPRRRRWWPWMIALPALTLVGVLIADRSGLITMPSWWRSTAQDIPLVGPVLVPPPASGGPVGDSGDGAARDRQLRDRVSARERGISLMSRERVGVLDDLARQQRLLDEATARLRRIESTSTRGMSPLQVDNLRVAHADAVAAAKNATLRTRQLSDRRDSLNRRIATAEAERDAALVDLGLAPAVTEAK